MTNKVIVAAIQMACTWDRAANLDKAESLIHCAAQRGAQLILLPELFETPYFCKDQKEEFFELANPVENHPFLDRFATIAAQLKVVLPLSFFEKTSQAFYNSIMMIDADGRQRGLYRKTHIPEGTGYQEKFYFSPGNTGLKVWATRYGTLGVGICWDQWFPEVARILALKGAEILLYPTAIGSEPDDPTLHSSGHWQRVMQGHAAANIMPLVAANRIGRELGESCEVTFYGSSFIANETGAIIAVAESNQESILMAEFDLERIRHFRTMWNVFQDRRPDQYEELTL